MKLSPHEEEFLKRLKDDEFQFVLDYYKDSEKIEWITTVFSSCRKLIDSLLDCKEVGVKEQLALRDLRSRLNGLGKKWLTSGGFSVIESRPEGWVGSLDKMLDRIYPAWKTTD